jgi:hypothetical protein
LIDFAMQPSVVAGETVPGARIAAILVG